MTIICDIDGTIADLHHRLPFIKGAAKDWDSFFANVRGDSPIWPVIRLLERFDDADQRIVLVSGRPEKTRIQTEAWLAENGVPWHELHMRPDGDFRQDYIVKSQILDRILEDHPQIDLVIDDRPAVVAMWRERGLFCLQCPWHEDEANGPLGLLTVMVGPSGAGKTTWLTGPVASALGIHPSQVVSSDQIRADLCGDWKDQSRNGDVFAAVHAVVKSRVVHGLPVVVDATNIKRKDRLAVVNCAPAGTPVRYVLIDRPLEDKHRDGGWRNEVPGPIERHHNTFKSQLADILAGDSMANVSVLDMRQ